MQCRGAKSFVDDLGLSRGVVLSRAAASLRSIETKPFDWQICPLWTDTSVGQWIAGRLPSLLGPALGSSAGPPSPLSCLVQERDSLVLYKRVRERVGPAGSRGGGFFRQVP